MKRIVGKEKFIRQGYGKRIYLFFLTFICKNEKGSGLDLGIHRDITQRYADKWPCGSARKDTFMVDALNEAVILQDSNGKIMLVIEGSIDIWRKPDRTKLNCRKRVCVNEDGTLFTCDDNLHITLQTERHCSAEYRITATRRFFLLVFSEYRADLLFRAGHNT